MNETQMNLAYDIISEWIEDREEDGDFTEDQIEEIRIAKSILPHLVP